MEEKHVRAVCCFHNGSLFKFQGKRDYGMPSLKWDIYLYFISPPRIRYQGRWRHKKVRVIDDYRTLYFPEIWTDSSCDSKHKISAITTGSNLTTDTAAGHIAQSTANQFLIIDATGKRQAVSPQSIGPGKSTVTQWTANW